MNKNRIVLIIFFMLSGFCAVFLSGYFFDDVLHPDLKDFPILNQAHKIIQDHSYYELPEETNLEYGMIRGMIQSGTDPQAIFLEPIQNELESNTLQGDYGGIGVQIDLLTEGYFILHPIPRGPAFRAGIQDGDRIIAIDKMAIEKTTSIESIEAAIRGQVSEELKLTISRPLDNKRYEFIIIREKFELPSVTWYPYLEFPQVAIIKINIIAATTPDEILKAFDESVKEGATHFLLDLRDNGGGLLTYGIKTAKLFLNDGIILHQQYRGKAIETFEVSEPGLLEKFPVGVLVNHSSASAAEIIAGALKSHGRAVIFGENTYGKNTIQLVFDLADGSSLHVTSAKWWIPGLIRPVEDGGIDPDVPLSQEQLSSEDALRVPVEYLLAN